MLADADCGILSLVIGERFGLVHMYTTMVLYVFWLLRPRHLFSVVVPAAAYSTAQNLHYYFICTGYGVHTYAHTEYCTL